MPRAVLEKERTDLPVSHSRHGNIEVGELQGEKLYPRSCWSQATIFPTTEDAIEHRPEGWKVREIAQEPPQE